MLFYDYSLWILHISYSRKKSSLLWKYGQTTWFGMWFWVGYGTFLEKNNSEEIQ